MSSMRAARFASKTSARATMSALCSSSAATNTSARAFAYSSSAQGADRLAPLDQRGVFRLGLGRAGGHVVAPPLPGRGDRLGERLHLGGRAWPPRRSASSTADRAAVASRPQRLRRRAAPRSQRCSAAAQAARSSRRATDQSAGSGRGARRRPARPTAPPRDRSAARPCGRHRRQRRPGELVRPESRERRPVLLLGRRHRVAGRGLARRQVRQPAPARPRPRRTPPRRPARGGRGG